MLRRYGKTRPEQADCFVQKRMVCPPAVTSQHSLPPPNAAQSAAELHGRYSGLEGHCSESVQVLMQHIASPSACEQFPSFAQMVPSGCVPVAAPAPDDPPVLVDPPVPVDPPVLVAPPVLVDPLVPVDPPVLVDPPTGIADVPPDAVEPPFPPESCSDSESPEPHPTEPTRAARAATQPSFMLRGIVWSRSVASRSGSYETPDGDVCRTPTPGVGQAKDQCESTSTDCAGVPMPLKTM
jgi:hypothetical protein